MCCASGRRAFPRSDRSSEPGGDAIIDLTTSSGSEIIKRLLYDEGYTIKGVQKLFKEQGVQALSAVALSPVAPSVEAAGSVEPHAGPQEDPGMRETYPGIADDARAALREALAEIMEAQRILAQASAPAT